MKSILKIKNFCSSFINIFLSNHCFLCGEFISEAYLCHACLKSLSRYKNKSPDFFAMYEFSKDIRKLLHLIKYDHRVDIAHILGREIASFLKLIMIFQRTDILIPVPIHKKREKIREYNQSLEICRGIALETNISIDNNFLTKSKNNMSQTKLSKQERIKNVSGCYQIKNTINKENRIIVVDDVITTGSTMNGIKNVLLNAGYKELFFVSIAATKRDSFINN